MSAKNFNFGQSNLVLGIRTPEISDAFYHWNDFMELCDSSVTGFIARPFMETNEDWMHFIPYIAFRFQNPETKEYMLYTYQRTQKIGEEKLIGQYSVGVGGHVELDSLVVKEQKGKPVIDVLSTLIKAAYTEISEEVEFAEEFNPADVLNADTFANEVTVFIDRDDPSNGGVGKFHIALMMVIDVPSNSMKVKEEELVHVGFLRKEELSLLAKEGKLENWSTRLTEFAI